MEERARPEPGLPPSDSGHASLESDAAAERGPTPADSSVLTGSDRDTAPHIDTDRPTTKCPCAGCEYECCILELRRRRAVDVDRIAMELRIFLADQEQMAADVKLYQRQRGELRQTAETEEYLMIADRLDGLARAAPSEAIEHLANNLAEMAALRAALGPIVDTELVSSLYRLRDLRRRADTGAEPGHIAHLARVDAEAQADAGAEASAVHPLPISAHESHHRREDGHAQRLFVTFPSEAAPGSRLGEEWREVLRRLKQGEGQGGSAGRMDGRRAFSECLHAPRSSRGLPYASECLRDPSLARDARASTQHALQRSASDETPVSRPSPFSFRSLEALVAPRTGSSSTQRSRITLSSGALVDRRPSRASVDSRGDDRFRDEVEEKDDLLFRSLPDLSAEGEDLSGDITSWVGQLRESLSEDSATDIMTYPRDPRPAHLPDDPGTCEFFGGRAVAPVYVSSPFLLGEEELAGIPGALPMRLAETSGSESSEDLEAVREEIKRRAAAVAPDLPKELFVSQVVPEKSEEQLSQGQDGMGRATESHDEHKGGGTGSPGAAAAAAEPRGSAASVYHSSTSLDHSAAAALDTAPSSPEPPEEEKDHGFAGAGGEVQAKDQRSVLNLPQPMPPSEDTEAGARGRVSDEQPHASDAAVLLPSAESLNRLPDASLRDDLLRVRDEFAIPAASEDDGDSKQLVLAASDENEVFNDVDEFGSSDHPALAEALDQTPSHMPDSRSPLGQGFDESSFKDHDGASSIQRIDLTTTPKPTKSEADQPGPEITKAEENERLYEAAKTEVDEKRPDTSTLEMVGQSFQVAEATAAKQHSDIKEVKTESAEFEAAGKRPEQAKRETSLQLSGATQTGASEKSPAEVVKPEAAGQSPKIAKGEESEQGPGKVAETEATELLPEEVKAEATEKSPPIVKADTTEQRPDEISKTEATVPRPERVKFDADIQLPEAAKLGVVEQLPEQRPEEANNEAAGKSPQEMKAEATEQQSDEATVPRPENVTVAADEANRVVVQQFPKIGKAEATEHSPEDAETEATEQSPNKTVKAESAAEHHPEAAETGEAERPPEVLKADETEQSPYATKTDAAKERLKPSKDVESVSSSATIVSSLLPVDLSQQGPVPLGRSVDVDQHGAMITSVERQSSVADVALRIATGPIQLLRTVLGPAVHFRPPSKDVLARCQDVGTETAPSPESPSTSYLDFMRFGWRMPDFGFVFGRTLHQAAADSIQAMTATETRRKVRGRSCSVISRGTDESSSEE